jgi:hypothetical protein
VRRYGLAADKFQLVGLVQRDHSSVTTEDCSPDSCPRVARHAQTCLLFCTVSALTVPPMRQVTRSGFEQPVFQLPSIPSAPSSIVLQAG